MQQQEKARVRSDWRQAEQRSTKGIRRMSGRGRYRCELCLLPSLLPSLPPSKRLSHALSLSRHTSLQSKRRLSLITHRPSSITQKPTPRLHPPTTAASHRTLLYFCERYDATTPLPQPTLPVAGAARAQQLVSDGAGHGMANSCATWLFLARTARTAEVCRIGHDPSVSGSRSMLKHERNLTLAFACLDSTGGAAIGCSPGWLRKGGEGGIDLSFAGSEGPASCAVLCCGSVLR
ncbi:hypothetical protein BJ546DRAFT_137305 [Cryomyces antarcticus]